MHEIFVNYRTGDAQQAASGLFDDLSRRFGKNAVFFASASIGAGREYAPELLDAARRCQVLLAVIGPGWARARDAAGERAVDHEHDWPRREIVEALHWGVTVVPVLLDDTARPDPNELPLDLVKLADCQYRRLHYRSREQDIARIVEDIVHIVPGLAEHSSASTARAETEAVHNSVRDSSGMSVQARDIGTFQSGGMGAVSGHVGTIVNGASGPLHTGSGNQFYGSTLAGDELNLVSGDHQGSVQQHFGDRCDQCHPDQHGEQR